MSERLFGRLPSSHTASNSQNLVIKGKDEREPVRVIDLGAGIRERRGQDASGVANG
jgi:hypothetical protein